MRLLFSRSPVRTSDVVELLLIRGLFLIFLISFYRAALCHVLAGVCLSVVERCSNYLIGQDDFFLFRKSFKICSNSILFFRGLKSVFFLISVERKANSTIEQRK